MLTAGIAFAAVLSLRADCPVPNYWCTWATQGSKLGQSVSAGKLAFAGDQGRPGQRDNLNERVLFDSDGWAVTGWGNVRGDLYLMLDDGWDVPYGAKSVKGKGSPFGSCTPDPERFPSFAGSPAERLKALSDRVRSLGWRGIALWVACQTPGETRDRPYSDEHSREAWAERMCISKAAGVDYWKVDWGIHAGSASYREMMSQVRDRIHPTLRLEHCMCSWPLDDGTRDTNRTDRILAASDVFRTYDVLAPLAVATTLGRVAWLSSRADSQSLRTLLNVEDEPILAAALGHLMGVMRPPAASDQAKDVEIALAWQRLAPPFGHDQCIKTLVSETELVDTWQFEPGSTWYKAVVGKTVEQKAPSAVVRGLPLPEVRASGETPFVCGARFPNGALALALLPRTASGRKRMPCPAVVSLDVRLDRNRPLALFGPFESVALKGGVATGARVFARHLPAESARDVTDLCKVGGDGCLVIPGSLVDAHAACPNVVVEAR